MTERNSPRVVVSVTCPACGAAPPSADPCTRCADHGILLLWVAPEHAAWSDEDLLALYAPEDRAPTA